MGLVLVMEPDYLPIPEIFVSAVTYTPGGLHTHEDCTPFRDRGVWGELAVLGVRKHYIFVSWLCILYRVIL